MTEMTGIKDQITGKGHEIAGAAKEKIGELTHNPELEAEGAAERIAGTVQKKVGEIKHVIGK